MLDWAREHQNIASTGLHLMNKIHTTVLLLFVHLYCSFEELLLVVGVAGVDVGPGHVGGAPVLRVEVGQEGDHSEGEQVGGREIHVALTSRPQVSVSSKVNILLFISQ